MLRAVGSVVFRRHVIQKPAEIAKKLNTSTCCMVYQDEPDYLKYLKPQVPVYETVNIQFKGYDFTVLERYGRCVHKIAINMDLDVKDAWASPHQAFRVTNTEPNSTKVAHDYHLHLYERNIQVVNMAAYSASAFFDVIQSMLPAGASLSIHHHEKCHEDHLYIPDFELIDLNRQLLEVEAEMNATKAEELAAAQKAEKEALKAQKKPETEAVKSQNKPETEAVRPQKKPGKEDVRSQKKPKT